MLNWGWLQAQLWAVPPPLQCTLIIAEVTFNAAVFTKLDESHLKSCIPVQFKPALGSDQVLEKADTHLWRCQLKPAEAAIDSTLNEGMSEYVSCSLVTSIAFTSVFWLLGLQSNNVESFLGIPTTLSVQLSSYWCVTDAQILLFNAPNPPPMSPTNNGMEQVFRACIKPDTDFCWRISTCCVEETL